MAKLRKLAGYDIVVIVDDSSSMKNPAHEAPPDDPFAVIPSRWDELKGRVRMIVEVATCLDRDGIDIYFLNGQCFKNVCDPEFADTLFFQTPDG